MADPSEEKLEDLEAKIDETRRQAEEHGTLEGEPERTLVDPDADGSTEGTGAPPP